MIRLGNGRDTLGVDRDDARGQRAGRKITITMKITDNEVRFMRALQLARERFRYDEQHSGHAPKDLARNGLTEHPDSVVQGMHQTAASLRRKGMVTRHQAGPKGRVGYKITDDGLQHLVDLDRNEKPSADDQRQDRRQARLPERVAAVSQPDPAEWHGISRVTGHVPADCPGPVMCDYAKSQPAKQYAREYWHAVGSTRLAKIISGICGVSQVAGEQLAGMAVDSASAFTFGTETRVAGYAKLGIQTRHWRVSRWTSGLANPGPDGWKLERLEDES